MPGAAFTESVVEHAALNWLKGLGYVVQHGPAIAPGELGTAPFTGCSWTA